MTYDNLRGCSLSAQSWNETQQIPGTTHAFRGQNRLRADGDQFYLKQSCRSALFHRLIVLRKGDNSLIVEMITALRDPSTNTASKGQTLGMSNAAGASLMLGAADKRHSWKKYSSSGAQVIVAPFL